MDSIFLCKGFPKKEIKTLPSGKNDTSLEDDLLCFMWRRKKALPHKRRKTKLWNLIKASLTTDLRLDKLEAVNVALIVPVMGSILRYPTASSTNLYVIASLSSSVAATDIITGWSDVTLMLAGTTSLGMLFSAMEVKMKSNGYYHPWYVETLA